MSKNANPVPTSSEVSKRLDHENEVEIEKKLTAYEEYYEKLRKLYLDHPDRNQFFSYDLIETLWFHIHDFYGVAIGNEEVGEIIDDLIQEDRIYEIVYDISEKLATKRGWEEK